MKAETEDATSEPSPSEVPTADEAQLEEAVAAVAIDTQVEHQAAGESSEAYEGGSEPVVDGNDANADVRDGGNSGGYNKYQGDRNYRNNNSMNGNRQQRTSYNNSGSRSNNRQNMGGVAAASTAGAAQPVNANAQYYMDANGVYYMYYPAYGGYYPVDPRYVLIFDSFQSSNQISYFQDTWLHNISTLLPNSNTITQRLCTPSINSMLQMLTRCHNKICPICSSKLPFSPLRRLLKLTL